MVKYDASYIYWSEMKTFGIIDDPSGQPVARPILEASTNTTEEERNLSEEDIKALMMSLSPIRKK